MYLFQVLSLLNFEKCRHPCNHHHHSQDTTVYLLTDGHGTVSTFFNPQVLISLSAYNLICWKPSCRVSQCVFCWLHACPVVYINITFCPLYLLYVQKLKLYFNIIGFFVIRAFYLINLIIVRERVYRFHWLSKQSVEKSVRNIGLGKPLC